MMYFLVVEQSNNHISLHVIKGYGHPSAAIMRLACMVLSKTCPALADKLLMLHGLMTRHILWGIAVVDC